MTRGRHSYVPFYVSDWLAGTALLTREQRTVLFEICCYTWDKAEPCRAKYLPVMFSGLEGWQNIVDELIQEGKLVRTQDGEIFNERALFEAHKAFELWKRKSAGGQGRRSTDADTAKKSLAKTLRKSAKGEPEPEPEPEPDPDPDPEPDPDIDFRPERKTELEAERESKRLTKWSATERANLSTGTRLPIGWVPTAVDDQILARIAHWSREEALDELARFRDYYRSQPGSKGVRTDWDATWRLWLRNAVDRRTTSRGKPSGWAFGIAPATLRPD